MRIIILFWLLSFSFFIGIGQPLPQVRIKTSMGNIVAELDTVNAPITAKNFLNLVKTGALNNAVFYRVVRMDNQPNNAVKIEVVQGGLFDDEKIAKYPSIQHETTKMTGLKHLNGTLSMARYEPGTASTEFSICIGDQPELDFGGKRNPDGQGFAAFGTVLSGMEVAKKIQKQKDNQQYLVEPVSIYSIKIL
ncbi:peptidylprolyl isomerase [Maribellus comscasis]|uniref:peptidylprolyl isomerase n=2 Tax=Maribellus comscasis TaxID=2681766 RepID=A0A6I6JSN8_9BACT|nr:peptidylprolyl isomerase [Maribellus comscasis]QGY44120.1 peptidylprolyl isomerase [Maribellus comscasis]